MTREEKIEWNRKNAQETGWSPSWFGAKAFDAELITKIIKFQEANGLTADGLVGSRTFSVAYTNLEAIAYMVDNSRKEKFIICGDKQQSIAWDKVVSFVSPDGLRCRPGSYKEVNDKVRKPSLIIVHWDCCLSAKSCCETLARRGISTHFIVDNDSTIFQTVSTNDITWNCGTDENDISVSIDVSDAFYTKYNKIYVQKGFGERPIVVGAKCHGKVIAPFLDFYDCQKQALKALIKSIAEAYNIPLVCPTDKSGKMITTVYKPAQDQTFHGIVSHMHLKNDKLDCCNLDLVELLKEI